MNQLAIQRTVRSRSSRVDALASEAAPTASKTGVRSWLRECHGFRVDSPLGRLGVIQEVRFNPGEDQPYALAISAGLFGGRLLIVDVREIAAILPRQKRLVIEASPNLLATEP